MPPGSSCAAGQRAAAAPHLQLRRPGRVAAGLRHGQRGLEQLAARHPEGPAGVAGAEQGAAAGQAAPGSSGGEGVSRRRRQRRSCGLEGSLAPQLALQLCKVQQRGRLQGGRRGHFWRGTRREAGWGAGAACIRVRRGSRESAKNAGLSHAAHGMVGGHLAWWLADSTRAGPRLPAKPQCGAEARARSVARLQALCTKPDHTSRHCLSPQPHPTPSPIPAPPQGAIGAGAPAPRHQ